MEESFETIIARFDDACVAEVSNVLLWFPGEDILAGIAEWLSTKAFASPGAFRASLRDWIIANPERALELLPERKSSLDGRVSFGDWLLGVSRDTRHRNRCLPVRDLSKGNRGT
ncbi:MAG: hypothetical protein V1792_06655 [Pseudomonadota bacterium]